MAKRTRLIDIAKKVGVSIGSVSAVLSPNLSGNMKVGPELTARIKAVAKEMHYVPNSAARILAGRPSGLIGVLMDTHAPAVCFHLLAEIEKSLAKRGLRVLTGMSHNDVNKMFETYQALIQHGVDGILCISYDYPGELEHIIDYFKGEKKIVFVNGPEVKGHSCVRIDSGRAVEEAVKYLYANGRKKLGFVCSKGSMAVAGSRIEGFLTATNGEGLIFKTPTLAHDSDLLRDSLKIAVNDFIIKEQIDGVVTLDDMSALTLMSELRRAGLSIPDDVAVVGYDNDIFSSLLEPPLATIDTNLPKLAEEAIASLLDIIGNVDYKPTVKSVIPTFLPRESAGGI